MKKILDEKRLTVLDGQLKRKFDCVAHSLTLTDAGNSRFKVRVGGGNIGGFHLAMTVSGWLEDMGFEPSYVGRTRGRFGAHILEVRS